MSVVLLDVRILGELQNASFHNHQHFTLKYFLKKINILQNEHFNKHFIK